MMPQPYRLGSVLTALLLLLGQLGCGPGEKKSSASTSEKPRNEIELSRTTLSKPAQESLGIQTVPIRIEMVQEHRTLPGWIMAKPGNEVSLTTPVGGYVRLPASNTLTTPGTIVKAGQNLFSLEPVLSPVELTTLTSLRRGIESDLAKARDSFAVAENELKRIESLVKQSLRGPRDVEQAQMQMKSAKEDLVSAQDKLKSMGVSEVEKGTLKLSIMPLNAPRSGVVVQVFANPGQYLAAAAPLASIADLSQPWLRVPVPEYDLVRLDAKQEARARLDPRQNIYLKAKPTTLIPQVDPIKHTADLLYELEIPKDSPSFLKDQMLQIEVPIGKRSEESVVPYSAVIFDAYGSSWIYLDKTPAKATEGIYQRVRVELVAPLGADVAVRPGLKVDERVVSVGAAALFSREFHFPPISTPEVPAKVK